MSVFCQLKQSLIHQLETRILQEEWQVVTACIDIGNIEIDALGYLKGQHQFPHFFWQHRDGQTTLFSLGVAQRFDTIQEANTFSLQQNMYVVGGIEFEGQAHFILPRLLFVKNASTLTAYCMLKASEHNEVLAFLQGLKQTAHHTMSSYQLLNMESASHFECWEKNIGKAISEIKAGVFDKVVLANATTMTFNKVLSAYDLLSDSRQKNYGCFHFLWSENGNEIFIGSSPERLYQRQQRTFLTEALAGTVAVSDDPLQTDQNALWLLSDHKNRYENWLVVDDICEHLADCTSDIEVGEAEIKRLRNVQHLRRKIHTVLLDNICDSDCLERIHPTAAVAGLPRDEAKQFIAENEGFKRGWYAGTLGYISPELAEFCVTLRSALVVKEKLTIYAGAGIVAESDPESEWQEIARKALAMADLVHYK